MNLQGFLSKEELDAVRDRSDTIAVWQIFFNYALIVLGFAVFIAWPSPLTFLLGAMVQAGRILGLAVLNHEAAHHTLFRTRSLNRPVARWLLAGPSLTDFDAYRSGHMKHHQYAGTLKDPDISFVKGYPTSVPSMRRKFIRDLTGQTGMQDLKYLIRLSSLKKRLPFLVSHLTFIVLLAATGSVWAYALWWTGFIFFYPAFMRIRVMGEHGAVADIFDKDPRRNTRTTLASPIERLFIAPNYVNYHCEHHALASAPGYRLPALHRLLRMRGFYDAYPDAVEDGYLAVLKRCIGSADDRPKIDIGHGAASYAEMS